MQHAIFYPVLTDGFSLAIRPKRLSRASLSGFSHRGRRAASAITCSCKGSLFTA